MVHLLPVFARMAILRVVAAADLPANEACPEVNPGVTGGDALLADIRRGWGLRFEASEVKTGSGHTVDGNESEAPIGASLCITSASLNQLAPPPRSPHGPQRQAAWLAGTRLRRGGLP